MHTFYGAVHGANGEFVCCDLLDFNRKDSVECMSSSAKAKSSVISIILVEDRDIHICPHLLVRLLLFSGRCWAWRCFKKDATQRHQFRLCAQNRREWATYFNFPTRES